MGAVNHQGRQPPFVNRRSSVNRFVNRQPVDAGDQFESDCAIDHFKSFVNQGIFALSVQVWLLPVLCPLCGNFGVQERLCGTRIEGSESKYRRCRPPRGRTSQLIADSKSHPRGMCLG
jgi:hypothetical protein